MPTLPQSNLASCWGDGISPTWYLLSHMTLSLSHRAYYYLTFCAMVVFAYIRNKNPNPRGLWSYLWNSLGVPSMASSLLTGCLALHCSLFVEFVKYFIPQNSQPRWNSIGLIAMTFYLAVKWECTSSTSICFAFLFCVEGGGWLFGVLGEGKLKRCQFVKCDLEINLSHCSEGTLIGTKAQLWSCNPSVLSYVPNYLCRLLLLEFFFPFLDFCPA